MNVSFNPVKFGQGVPANNIIRPPYDQAFKTLLADPKAFEALDVIDKVRRLEKGSHGPDSLHTRLAKLLGDYVPQVKQVNNTIGHLLRSGETGLKELNHEFRAAMLKALRNPQQQP